MKAPYFFTILAFGALQANVGFAGHHGHHVSADTSVHASGTAARGQAQPAAQGPQGSTPSGAASDQIKESAAKDGAGVAAADKSGKHVTDTSGPHDKVSPKAGISADTAAPVDANRQRHLATPGNGAQEGGAGPAIDTLIAGHQGRRAANSKELKEIEDLKERLFKKSKTAIAPANDPIHLGIHSHQQTSSLGTDGGPVRNAIGAIIEHRTAVPQSSPPPPTDATRGISGMPTFGAQVSGERGPGTVSTGEQLSGTVPASSANLTQPGNHPFKTPTLSIVTTNGPALNGTGMIRPGAGTGAIGGPAKAVAGALNGSGFRPKHP